MPTAEMVYATAKTVVFQLVFSCGAEAATSTVAIAGTAWSSNSSKRSGGAEEEWDSDKDWLLRLSVTAAVLEELLDFEDEEDFEEEEDEDEEDLSFFFEEGLLLVPPPMVCSELLASGAEEEGAGCSPVFTFAPLKVTCARCNRLLAVFCCPHAFPTT